MEFPGAITLDDGSVPSATDLWLLGIIQGTNLDLSTVNSVSYLR